MDLLLMLRIDKADGLDWMPREVRGSQLMWVCEKGPMSFVCFVTIAWGSPRFVLFGVSTRLYIMTTRTTTTTTTTTMGKGIPNE